MTKFVTKIKSQYADPKVEEKNEFVSLYKKNKPVNVVSGNNRILGKTYNSRLVK